MQDIRYAVRATTLHYTRAACELMAVVGASPAVAACHPASEYPRAICGALDLAADSCGGGWACSAPAGHVGCHSNDGMEWPRAEVRS